MARANFSPLAGQEVTLIPNQDLLPRGGGAYLNEIDGNLTAWTHDDRMSRLRWTGKFRGPNLDPVEFRYPVIYTSNLKDTKGRLMPTAMAEVLSDAAIAEDEEKTGPTRRRLRLAPRDKKERENSKECRA